METILILVAVALVGFIGWRIAMRYASGFQK